MLFLVLSHSLACEIFFLSKIHSSICFSQLTVCAFEKAHSRLPEKTNGNLANQRKHNFYKRWRHRLRNWGPPVKIDPDPLPFNPALVTISEKAKFLTVSMATFRDHKQALYAAFLVCSYNHQSTAKQHHYHRRKISQNCYTIVLKAIQYKKVCFLSQSWLYIFFRGSNDKILWTCQNSWH